jgi:ribosomal-protein-alanine N-acetyltransferase
MMPSTRPPAHDDRVRVRDFRHEDCDELAHHANDRRVWLGLRDRFPHPYTAENARWFVTWVLSTEPRTNFAIEFDGRPVGGIGYTLHEDVERISAELGYWIGVECWGRGIATAAVRTVTTMAFDRHRHLRRLYAMPFAWNTASMRVLEKARYRHEATLRHAVIKDGQVLDQHIYAVLREELHDSAP